MNNLTKSLAVLSVLCTVFSGSYVFAQGLGEISRQAGMSEASWYIGHSVWSSDGEILGQISNLVIDKTNERVVLAVLSDVPGLETKVVAIPFASLTRIGKRLVISNYGLNEIWIRILNVNAYLNELKRDFNLVGLPSAIDPEWVYQIFLRYDQVPYWKEVGKNEKPLSEKDLYSLNKLMKSEVRSSRGKTEAQITDLIIDPSDGRVAFLILTHVSGRVDTKLAVPFGTLAMKDDNMFFINTTENMLAEAPMLNGDRIDLKWASDVYKYFGLQPYWTEEGR